MLCYISDSERATEEIAEKLAARLHPGDVIAYTGGLGAGKTAFTRGLARGLGCIGRVTSPTFAIVNRYDGNTPLNHFDMYRIDGFDSLYSTGFFDYLDGLSVTAVEWSENIEEYLPEGSIRIDICSVAENERRITITGDDRFADDTGD